jgi:uncharacterized protein (TIGR03437 family)
MGKLMIPIGSARVRRVGWTRYRVFPSLLLLVSSLPLAAESATKLSWTKKFGGGDYDDVRAMTTDAQGNLYIAGATTSVDLPANGAYKTPRGTNMYRIVSTRPELEPLVPAVGGSVIAIAAGPAGSGVFYASTSTGMMRSANSGDTWTAVPLPPEVTGLFASFHAFSGVQSMAVDPRNANVVYAAASPLGILKTTDGGEHWATLLAATSDQPLFFGVAIDPLAPDTVYVSSMNEILQSVSAYRTEDGGQSWTDLQRPISYVTPDTSVPGVLYGGLQSALVRSTDRGATWTDISPVPSCAANILLSDPVSRPNFYVLCGRQPYRSRDQGGTWTPLPANSCGEAFPASITADNAVPLLYLRCTDSRTFSSANGADTWTPLGSAPLPGTVLGASRGDLLIGGIRDQDAFAAKFTPDGDLTWATYLGGSGQDTAAAIAVDAAGSVYVAGTTSSSDIPISAYDGGTTPAGAVFVAKLSPLGTTVAYSARLKISGAVGGLGVDAAGDVVVGGMTYDAMPTTPGVAYPDTGTIPQTCNPFDPYNFYSCPIRPATPSRDFLVKLSPTGGTLLYATYVGDWRLNGHTPSVAVATDGSAYSAGNILWKFDQGATRVLWATVLGGADHFNAAALDSDGTLLVGGHSGAGLYATWGVWKPWPDESDGFLARYSARGGLLTSTSMGAEVRSISPAPDGTVVVGGILDGGSYYTRSLLQGPVGPGWAARVSGDFSQLLFSSYMGGFSYDNPLLVAALPGGALGAVQSSGTISADAGNSMPDVELYRADTADAAVRIDAVVNEAAFGPFPITANERLVISGVGFGDDSTTVTIGGADASILSRANGTLTVVAPGSLPADPPPPIVVHSANGDSASVPWPVAPAVPTLYHPNPYPDLQTSIYNSDGSLNSATNPAERGSVVAIAVNGVGAYTVSGVSIVPALPFQVRVSFVYADGVDANLLPVPGLPGVVPFVKVLVPDVPGTVYPAELPLTVTLGDQGPYGLEGRIWVK